MLLTITVNVVAFLLGTVLLDRYNLFIGVTVFVVTALTGTILSSMVEAFMISMLTPRLLARARRLAFREEAKPAPSSAGSS